MKTFVTKMMLAGAVATVPLTSTVAAYAQTRHAPPAAYNNGNAEDPYWAGQQRFTPQQQRIIDEITRNDQNSGY